MDDLKLIIAKNISELRHANDITQAELAEQLNYSDKAVSKWERGESIPDVTVLKKIADIFGVTVDYMLNETNSAPEIMVEESHRRKNTNHFIITSMSVFLVVLIATFAFVIVRLAAGPTLWSWLIYAYALPISLIIILIFNCVWFNTRYNYFIISVLMWTFTAVLILTFLAFGINVALLFAVCIPGQIIIIMWSRLRYLPKNKISMRLKKLKKKHNIQT